MFLKMASFQKSRQYQGNLPFISTSSHGPLLKRTSCQIKGKDLGESDKNNCKPLFYSKFRFWTANGWAICQWKKKYPRDHHLPGFKPNVFSLIGRLLSYLQFKIWILSKKWLFFITFTQVFSFNLTACAL